MLEDLILYAVLSDVFGEFGELVRAMAAIFAIIALAECFFGFKLFKIWIALCCFPLFGLLGWGIAFGVAEKVGVATFVGILAGIAGAFIAYRLFLVGVFLTCGFMGYILGYLLTNAHWPGILMGLVFGVLGVLFAKPVIIVSTAIPGGLLAGESLIVAFGGDSAAAALIIGLALAAAGLYVQWVTNRKVPARGFALAGAGATAQAASAAQGADAAHAAGSEAAAAAEAGSAVKEAAAAGDAAMDRLRQRVLQVSRGIGEELRERIEREKQAASQQAGGHSTEEALAIMAERIYANRAMQYVMPFAEILLVLVAVFSFIFSFRPLSALHLNFLAGALLVFLAALCLVKRNFPVLAASVLIVALGKLIAVFKWFGLSKMFYSVDRYAAMSLVEFLAAGAVAYFAVRAALRPDQAARIKAFSRRLRETLGQRGAANRQAVCPGCGAPNETFARFCSSCGASLPQQEQKPQA